MLIIIACHRLCWPPPKQNSIYAPAVGSKKLKKNKIGIRKLIIQESLSSGYMNKRGSREGAMAPSEKNSEILFFFSEKIKNQIINPKIFFNRLWNTMSNYFPLQLQLFHSVPWQIKKKPLSISVWIYMSGRRDWDPHYCH